MNCFMEFKDAQTKSTKTLCKRMAIAIEIYNGLTTFICAFYLSFSRLPNREFGAALIDYRYRSIKLKHTDVFAAGLM